MTDNTTHGIIAYSKGGRRTDYLYRISIKALIKDANGAVLVVKETGRDWWDLPGGGMDHGERVRDAIARELSEEINLKGQFDYQVIKVEDPAFLELHGFWQLRIIFEVIPKNMKFNAGDDGDEVNFIEPTSFKDSMSTTEQRIYEYFLLAEDTR